ncbi:MAG: hypothetical protein LBJ47_05420 [Tannerella sp.]|jgi:hypothetical protein|nr:hypothetical protein [Tannerella sp.]
MGGKWDIVIARNEAIQAQAMTRQPPGLHCLCLDCFTSFAMTVECVHNDRGNARNDGKMQSNGSKMQSNDGVSLAR